MFGSAALEFGIGMVFVYLMLSLAVTAFQEGLASLFRRRARTLASGIRNLLRDDALVESVYAHPLIQGLHLSKRRPSYIPSRIFALALLDRLTPPEQTPDAASVKAALQGNQSELAGALRLLLSDAQDDYERFVENIEVWFNHGMERVSGWYKRYTQGILMAVALPLTMLVNADSLDIACAIWKDPTVRAALVADAQNLQHAPPPPPAEPEELGDVIAGADQYISSLRAVQVPIGWAPASDRVPAGVTSAVGCRVPDPHPGWSVGRWMSALGRHWLGWLMTVLAISLGAPFWFDLLNRFMIVRGGGKAPEEKPKLPREEQPALGPGERAGEARRMDAMRPK
jgi:hypothetical protein